MAVLDSAFLVDLQHGHPGALAMRQQLHLERHVLRVPAVVWMEFLHVAPPALRGKVASELESSTRFEPFDRHLADAAAALQHDRRGQGKPLGWGDLQVAVTALHYGEPVISRDRAFAGVTGLVRLSY